MRLMPHNHRWALGHFAVPVAHALESGPFLLTYAISTVPVDLLTLPFRRRPSLGASGAGYGYMGIFLVLFPCAGIKTDDHGGELPALLGIPAYFFLDLYLLNSSEKTGINHTAHVFGLVAGLVFVLLLRYGGLAREGSPLMPLSPSVQTVGFDCRFGPRW